MSQETPWDDREITAYIPQPQLQKLRHVVIRATEMREAGVADEGNGFLIAAQKLQAALSHELSKNKFKQGKGVVSGDAVTLTNNDAEELAALRSKVKEQEDELIAMDDKVAAADEEIGKLKASLKKATKKGANK